MRDVFFFEAFEEEARELKRCLPADFRAGYTAATIQEYGSSAPPSPVISIRTQSAIPVEWLPRIRAILTRSTGYDHLLWLRELPSPPPLLGHLPLYCARAVAEQAMLFWMALLRRLPAQQSAFRSFHRDGLTGREAGGRRLAILGVGRIGIEVVAIGRSLGMEVVGVDLVDKYPEVDYASVEDALTGAEVVVAAMNLTEKNRGYFTRDLLHKCARGAIFVNVSRGELSPPPVLLDLLREGHLGGVGLDVFDDESRLGVALRQGASLARAGPAIRAILEMRDRDDVIMTPHNAFNTGEAVVRKSSQSVEQLRHLRKHGKFLWPVPG